MKKLTSFVGPFLLCSFLVACNEGKGRKQASDVSVPVSAETDQKKVKFPSFNEDYISRDIRDDLFYFVMTDRFSNGNKSNDRGSATQAIFSGGFDKTSDRKFHGGDLAGLKNRLDYIRGMGVTALWMTPFMGNKALHYAQNSARQKVVVG